MLYLFELFKLKKATKRFLSVRPVLLNSWVFDYELSGCRFESSCGHLKFYLNFLVM